MSLDRHDISRRCKGIRDVLDNCLLTAPPLSWTGYL